LQDLLSLEERQALVQYVKSLAERAGAVAELLGGRHETYAGLSASAQRSRDELALLLAALERAPVRAAAIEEESTELLILKR
jgi:hypothetical protein